MSIIKRLTLCLLFALSTVTASACPGDFDSNRKVNFADFLVFTSAFGKSSSDAGFDARMDLNGNGSVDFADFLVFTSAFGRDCPDPDRDRDALVALYQATDGANWANNANWLTDNDLSTWHGVGVSGGRVTRLHLQNNNLTGKLPSELSTLSDLEYLNFADNQLFGGIPTAFTALTALTSFNFNNNAGLCSPRYASFLTWSEGIADWSGGFCTDRDVLVALYHATDGANWTNNTNWLTDNDLLIWQGVRVVNGQVVELDLSENLLSGSIPSELGDLVNLVGLSLSDNNLNGPIPPELGNLVNLKTLLLNWNFLSGSIPPELGDLVNLEHLGLPGNNLSGSIPPELGNLVNLVGLSLSSNNLSGSIPPELGNLVNLEILDLSNNNLSGSIPSELGNLVNLEGLWLDGNLLSGSIPSELGNLVNLEILDLSNNNLSGSIPPELAQLNFAHLDLSNNIPLELLSSPPPVFLIQATQSATHSVPLIAGEVSLLRVFDKAVSPVRATFYRNGALVHTADISSSVIQAVIRGSENQAVEIPGSVVMPGLEMVVEIDPDGTLDPALGIGRRIPETGRVPVDVKAVPPLNLTLVPLLWQENPDHSVVTTARSLSADDNLFWYTRNLLPVHDLDLTVREPVWTSLDPVNDNRSELLSEIAAIHTLDGASGHYMGILRQEDGQYGGGIAFRGGNSLVSSLHASTIAHELGHNMSLGHAPCGTGGGLDPSYPYTDGKIGVWGYDFRAGVLVIPTRPDLMSYCYPEWISDYNFKKALEYRLSEEARASGKPAAATRTILLWGGVNASRELLLEPTFVVTAPPALPDKNGPYLLTGEDVDGSVLFSLNFGMPEIADGDGGSSFVFALPVQPEWPDRLAHIALSGPEGVVTMGSDEDRSVALLRDRTTGRVRGILRNWSDPSLRATRPTVPEPNLEVVVSRGIPDKAAWNR